MTVWSDSAEVNEKKNRCWLLHCAMITVDWLVQLIFVASDPTFKLLNTFHLIYIGHTAKFYSVYCWHHCCYWHYWDCTLSLYFIVFHFQLHFLSNEIGMTDSDYRLIWVRLKETGFVKINNKNKSLVLTFTDI